MDLQKAGLSDRAADDRILSKRLSGTTVRYPPLAEAFVYPM
jgi:hypothetical protein